MPKPLLIAIGFLAPFSGAAWAQDMAGNANFGRKTFKKCQSCHSIIKSDGQYIVKGGKLGPNLYGVIGRTAGTSDFRYGADLIMAGKMGLVWQVDTLSEYPVVGSRSLALDLTSPLNSVCYRYWSSFCVL